MRLIRLQLKNFRQHADTELVFRSGLTGIIGPNGAGKTTILEAMAWAIYGASAVRGTNETLRFNRAPGRSAVRAELEFALDGDRYRVVRTPRGAELYQGDRDDPIAAGVSEVIDKLQLTDRLPTNGHAVVSNVPGPKQMLYLKGSRVERNFPISTLSPGLRLNITMFSYAGILHFGLVSTHDLENLQDLADQITEEFELLENAVKKAG